MWEELIKGKIVYRELVTDPVTGKRRTVSVQAKKNTPSEKKAAKERLYAKLRQHKDVNMRMSALVEVFDEDQSATVKDSTRRRNRNTLDRLVKILGDPYIDKLTSGYIRKKLIEMKRDPETLNEYLRRFRTFWRWAYKNNYVESPAVADRLDNFKTQPHRLKIQDKFMEPEQAVDVIKALPEDYSLLMEFMLRTGLRFGEVSALDQKDAVNEIEVYKTRDAITGAITETKTQGSTRVVHVTPELRDLLSRINQFMNRRRMLTGSRCLALFLNDKGERVNLPAFNKCLKDVTTKILGRPLTSHSIRHTFASVMMANGVDISTIQRTLGHQSSEITKRIYLHVTEELKKKDNEALDGVSLSKYWDKTGKTGTKKDGSSN